MAKRLVIDLDLCDRCETCGVDCGYPSRPQPKGLAVLALRERATYAVVCRRCEEASCIAACPFAALERRADGVLTRHNLRCVSCKLCAHACPFGTIYLDMVPFYVAPCETCLARDDGEPPCAGSCHRGAIEYREVTGEEPDVHVVDEHLAARSRRWVKREAVL